MNAQVAERPFNHSDWVFEPKLDGYRATAYINDGKVKLLTRGGHDYSSYFPHIVQDLAARPSPPMVIDAELVAFAGGQPSFEALQGRVNKRSAAHRKDPAQCVLFCFDILHLAGMTTRDLPYIERRQMLLGAVASNDLIQIVHTEADGVAMYTAALAMGLEGVVAKRKQSPYRPGVRSPDWLKIKPSKTAKLLVVGYLRNQTGLTSLLVGYRHGGRLVYTGRVSSGLTLKLCNDLLTVLQRSPQIAPLSNRADAVWVAPSLVAEVRYYEVTQQGRLRHPVFVRLRDDIDPENIDSSTS
ncbi:MAG: ATP-dependent ligase [Burkholderia sp.]|nr:ATP-dependent ligase [Burkholderia sp.]